MRTSAAKAASTLAALILTGLSATACATAAPVGLDDGRLGYQQRMEARLLAAADVPQHTLRFNPTPCRCPPFEMLLDSQWVRVDLAVTDVDDPVLTALLEATRGERGDEALRTYRVDGALDDALSRCGGGALFVTLRPTAFVPARVDPASLGAPLLAPPSDAP